tara:strand:+ start:162 stop:581 length:420 start_codon:yes stop_codon:yes gene_type:complete
MSTLFLKGEEQFGLGEIDWVDDDIKLTYMSTSYTPDVDTENFYADISASAASGLSVETLANKTATIDTANNRVAYDADDAAQGPVSGMTNKYVLWKDTGSPTTSPLIACIDLTDGTVNVVASTLTTTFNAAGIFARNVA